MMNVIKTARYVNICRPVVQLANVRLCSNIAAEETKTKDTYIRGSAERCINEVTLLGRVGADPEIRGTENSPLVLFPLATNRLFKEDGGYTQTTDWHRVVAFNSGLRDIVGKYVKKGSRVLVKGRISYYDVPQDDKGYANKITSIVANDVVFMDSPKKSGLE